MRFLVDAQLPPALARFLRVLGHEADHVIDFQLETASDGTVWDFAREHSAVLITKDEDFRTLRLSQTEGPPVVWVRIGNTTTPHLLNRLSDVWNAVISGLERGEVLIEIR
ncbi:MAG: DUF5615 family PIN-like protein [Methyloceanibacter sp.]|uniref:DUF5615 family PIN-like protein n=1 Tax=Methyloceanibacter sp. TaxID=1965321 RepID=UPI003D6CB591